VVKEKPVPYDTVKIDYPIDLRLAAECVDATAEDLLDLNPSLLRMTTPKDAGMTFELHLPAGTADKFQTAVASIPADKRVWWRYHKVQSRRNAGLDCPHLSHDSGCHCRSERPVTSGTRESQVAAKRSPASAHRHAGIATATVKSVADPAADSAAATHETVKHHTVKQGETLYSIASSYNTTVSALKHDNRNLAVLRPGMVLVVRDAH
jgi:membrane-bound lytic murein transglycosylase D